MSRRAFIYGFLFSGALWLAIVVAVAGVFV
jgi:hypothetical protein